MKLECAGITDVGTTRDHNEDDFYLSQGEEALCIVADGMGGHRSGEVASAMAIRAIVEYYRETMPGSGFSPAKNGEESPSEVDLDQYRLSHALLTANRVVFDAASGNEDYQGMGTTIVTGYFTETGVYMAHIGDSRGYRLRDGKLQQITHDHSLANEYVRMGILLAEDVEFFPYKNVITRACGLSDNVEVDVLFDEFQAGDLYLLCSDGLSDMVPDRELVEIVKRDLTLDAMCQELVRCANENGGADNITLILARVVA
ncbi:MAG: Stp1/IreP family PP2C-type Ser/Thr phosphatase [Bradymonadaceae bacterium]|nr:Stp1/IreP family PP2C-type Ser/Thr phosphatase [Lujinxingiaceae bacterium]